MRRLTNPLNWLQWLPFLDVVKRKQTNPKYLIKGSVLPNKTMMSARTSSRRGLHECPFTATPFDPKISAGYLAYTRGQPDSVCAGGASVFPNSLARSSKLEFGITHSRALCRYCHVMQVWTIDEKRQYDITCRQFECGTCACKVERADTWRVHPYHRRALFCCQVATTS